MSDAFYAPKRAMVIVAHPDDIEFGCAGTVARWVKAGAEVCYVLCTSGDVGIAKPELTRAQVTEIREAENSSLPRWLALRKLSFCASRTARWSTRWICASGWCARFAVSAPRSWSAWIRPSFL